jgi:SAM-dependent methyltransferase
MESLEDGIYQDPTFKEVDIGAIMRSGHPDIKEGDEYILGVIRRLREELRRPLRVLDVGSGSGHLSLLLARELRDCEIVANETAAAPLEQARAKLAPFDNASVFGRSFDFWEQTVDVIISWGSHHHLSHDYLRHVREVLAPDGLLVIGDEFCPEYLTPADQERLRAAERIVILDGFIFDDEQDIRTYGSSGVVPEWNQRLERARRRALWTWYKFVGDYAVAKDAWMVLLSELQIARDDFITGFAGEHKVSPFLLERELTLNGFAVTDREAIGNRKPALQSFVVYTCRPSASASETSGVTRA